MREYPGTFDEHVDPPHGGHGEGNGATDEQAGRLKPIHLSHYDSHPIPAFEWSIPDRFPLRHVSLLSGEGGAGKTKILGQLSAAQPLGRDWLRSIPERGPVLMVSCEEEEAEIARRLKPSLDLYGVTFREAVQAGLHICSLAGQDAVMAYADASEKVTATPLYDELKQMAGDIKPRSIILDNSADIFGGNENSRVQVRQFVTMLRQVAIVGNSAVIVSSHPSLTGLTTKTGLSGSTAWHNSARARAWLRTAATTEGDEPDPDLRELVFMKNNYGPLGEPVLLRWRNGLFVPETRAGSIERMADDIKVDELFLTMLARFNRQCRDLSPKKSSTYAPAVFAREPDAQGAKAKAFEAAMSRLFATEKIKVENSGSPSRPRSRLVVG